MILHVAVDAVAVVPGGAHSSYAHDYYLRDISICEDWAPARTPASGSEDLAGYLQSISKRETLVAERSA